MAGKLWGTSNLGGYVSSRRFRQIDPNEQAAKDAFEEEVLLDGLVKGISWYALEGVGLSMGEDRKKATEEENKRLDEEILGNKEDSITTKKSI